MDNPPGAGQRVMTGFVAGRFDLPVGMVAGSAGVLMGSVDRGIHRHVPVDGARSVRPRPGHGQAPRPDTVALPLAKQLVDQLPMPITLRRLPPRRPEPDPPPNLGEQLATCLLRMTPHPWSRRQHALQHRPLPVRQILPRADRYADHGIPLSTRERKIINTEHGPWLNGGLGKRVNQSEHRAATGRHPEPAGESSPCPAR